MTDTTGLAAPGGRAVLVGTGSHAPGSALPALPGVDTTLDDLARVLREVCGMERVHRVPAQAVAADVMAAVEEAVTGATGPVLFCYVGHGILGPRDELYLATHASPAADRVSAAVPYRTVRDLLGDAVGGSVTVLDCCFSGRATAPDGRPADPFASARPDGSFLLTSASQFAVSFAPEGARHTLFSGHLLRLLEDGDPGGPPRLTLDHLYAAVERELRDGPARPYARSDGTLGGLVVAPNRAYRPGPVPRAEPPADVPCPYPGMRSFGPADREWFHGREKLTERLVDAARDPASDHPVVLVGASGAGKSSLLGAGLLAGLEARHGAGGDDVPWPALLLPSPGEDPLGALAGLWSRACGGREDEVRQALSAGRFPSPAPGRRACRLLAVDQFEEVFTHCADAQERTRFIRLLCAGTGERPQVVLALRADHYADCLAHPELVSALEAGQFTVPPMSLDALRTVIEQPAERAGLVLEDGLTDRLLHDLRRGGTDDEPVPDAATPFLAHALAETWVNRSGAVLTLAGYQRTGGIWQSVTTSAERLHQSLEPPGRRALRGLLLNLVHLTPGGEAVGRRVSPAALIDRSADRDMALIQAVWNGLLDSRLITADRDWARISHDALLQTWPRLRSWIRDARADLLEHQRLAEAAADWEDHDRDPGYLYTGTRLAQVRPWLGRDTEGQALTSAERDFLVAGVRAERRHRLRRRVLAGTAMGAALLLIGVGVVAYVQRGHAQERAALLASQRIAAQAEALRVEDPVTALDLSLEAYRVSPTVEARSAVLEAALAPAPPVVLSGHTNNVVNVAYRAGGKVLASSAEDGTVRLWNTADPYRPAPGPVLRLGHTPVIAWRPDGRYLAAGTNDALFVWDTRDALHPHLVTRLRTGTGKAFSAAFSPDGRTLAVAADHDRAWLWDLTDPRRPRRTAMGGAKSARVAAVAFSPDSRTLAEAVGDGTVELWNTTDPHAPKQRKVIREALVESLAFSPDGRLLAGGGASGEVNYWKVTDPDHPQGATGVLQIGKKTMSGVAFSPDGKYMVASSWDRQLHTYTVDIDGGYSDPLNEGSSPERPGGGNDLSVAYRPDGRGVVLGGSDGRVRLWNPPANSVPGTSDDAGAVKGSGFDKQGWRLTTGTADGRTRIWRLSTPDGLPVQEAVLPKPWRKARFLPGEKALLISQDTTAKRLRLWGYGEGRLQPGKEFRTADGASDQVLGFDSTDDGTVLALDDRSVGTVTFWNIRNLAHPQRLGHLTYHAEGTTNVFSGGRDVFVVMAPGWADVWDVSDPRNPRRRTRVRENPASATSSNGRRLLMTDAGNGGVRKAKVWELSRHGTSRPLGTLESDPLELRLVSDHLLAGLSTSGRPTLWDLNRLGTPIPLTGPLPFMNDLSSNGDLLTAWGGGGSGLGLWRIATDGSSPAGSDLLALTGPSTPELTVQEFTPQGDAMVVQPAMSSALPALGAGTLLLDTDLARLSRTLCLVRGTPTTEKRWHQFFPDLTYADPCR